MKWPNGEGISGLACHNAHPPAKSRLTCSRRGRLGNRRHLLHPLARTAELSVRIGGEHCDERGRSDRTQCSPFSRAAMRVLEHDIWERPSDVQNCPCVASLVHAAIDDSRSQWRNVTSASPRDGGHARARPQLLPETRDLAVALMPIHSIHISGSQPGHAARSIGGRIMSASVFRP